MNTPEMTDVPVEVEFFGYNRVSRCLLQIETGWRDEITRSEEVGEFSSDVPVGLCKHSIEVLGCLSALAPA
jgi:hypothetical protein